MTYIDDSMRVYLADLAARKPAPGGGSAAALSASIGAALMSMVANYTIGNPKYKSSEGAAAGILTKTEKARADLQRLVDEDVAAYTRLSKAIKEYGKDASKLDQIYKDALKPPFEVCKIAAECLEICGTLAECGNRNLITDTAIAAILLEGAFLSAKYNVYINLKYIKDTGYIGKIHETLFSLEATVGRLREEILEKCEEVIR